MARSLRARMMRGGGAQMVSQGFHTAVRLGEVPFFLYFWGAELYGEWLILTAFPSYLAMSGMGFPGAASRDMAVKVAAGDRAEALAVFQSITVLVLALASALALAFVAIVSLLPFDGWFQISRIEHGEAVIILAFLSLNIVFHQMNQVLYGGFYSEGRYAEGTVMMTCSYATVYTALGLAVALNGAPLLAAASMAVGCAASTVLMYLVLRRQVPWARIGLAHASRGCVQRLLKPALASMAFPLGQAFNHQGVRLMVGAALGPAAVTVLVALRVMTRLIPRLAYSLAGIFQPEMGAALGKQDYGLLRKLNRRCTQLTLWTVGSMSLVIWVLADTILALWTGGRIAPEPSLIGLLLAVGFLESLWQAMVLPVFAANRHTRIALVFLVASTWAVLGTYSLASLSGIDGAGQALLIAELAMLVFVLPASIKLTHDKGSDWLGAVLPPPWYLWREARRALSKA